MLRILSELLLPAGHQTARVDDLHEERRERLGREGLARGLVGDGARIVKIDVDQHEELAAKYRIQAVPTFIVFKKGEAVWRHSGVIKGSELKGVIEQNS